MTKVTFTQTAGDAKVALNGAITFDSTSCTFNIPLKVTAVPTTAGRHDIQIELIFSGDAIYFSEKAKLRRMIAISSSASSDVPFISAIPDQTINANIASDPSDTGLLSFTIGAPVTPVSSLTLSATSSNTALILNSGIVFGGSDKNRTLVATPILDKVGTSTIKITVSNGTNTASTSFLLTVNAINQAPTISTISDQLINKETNTGLLTFALADDTTPIDSIILSTASSNQSIIKDAGISLGGSGGNRTIKVTHLSSSTTGKCSITVTAMDLNGVTTFLTFWITVNAPPLVVGVSDWYMEVNSGSAPLNFTVSDDLTPLNSLVFSTLASSNTDLVPNNNISIIGSNANRTITVTPLPKKTGKTTVNFTCTDSYGGIANVLFMSM